MNNRCFFCKNKTFPSYKDPETLKKFLTVRGKIMPRERSLVCALHQRKLANEIKIARTLALVPYLIYEV